MGEFELALVFYHRGKKLRGDVKEFQLGINKAQEAIDNCVGDPHNVKLEVKGDLSYFNKADDNKKKNFKIVSFQKKQQVVPKREKRTVKPGTQKTVKQLLGELYADKVYLEKLLSDDNITRVNTVAGDAIWSLANNGLDFLDSRTEFWRQQKPIYARKNSYTAAADSSSNNPLNYVIKQLETIDALQTKGNYKASLASSNKLLNYVKPLNKKQLSGKDEIIANINSNIGNAYLEMGRYDLAIPAHEKDLEISKELDNKEGISRAYENIGRVYARNGKYSQAIEVWEKKLPLAETDMERAWLYHEIGRCQLELCELDEAKDYGEKSLECAKAIDDEVWQLNATVLIAQSDVKIGTASSLNAAIDNFEKALKMTEKQDDTTAGNAIVKALADCKQKLEKLGGEDGDETIATEADRESVKSAVKERPKSIVSVKKEEPKKEEEVKPEPEAEPEPVPEKEPEPVEEPEPVQEKADETEKSDPVYRVEVKTSDDYGSGTDASVYISIIGDNASVLNHPLKKSSSNQDQFEQGQLDVFWINSKTHIGKPIAVKVGHDGKGYGSGFLMDYVQVNFEDQTYKFDTNGKWVEEDEDSGECEIELKLAEVRPDNSSNYNQ